MKPGKPRVALPTRERCVRQNLGAAAPLSDPVQAVAALKATPSFLQIPNRLTIPHDLAVSTTDPHSLVVFFDDGSIRADGRPVTVNPLGRIQFHGYEHEPERVVDFLLQISRNEAGDSANGCTLSRLNCTGQTTKAHLALDSIEIDMMTACIFEQYNGDGAAVTISNASRDGEDRAKATSSGHLILGCGFANFGYPDNPISTPPTTTGMWRGTGLRLHGFAELGMIVGGWAAGTGEDTAITMISTGMESFNDGANGRENTPKGWIVDGMVAEGAPYIRLYNYRDFELLRDTVYSPSGAYTTWKTVRAKCLDGQWHEILTLRGNSCRSAERGGFIVTDGDSDRDLFEAAP